MNTSKDKYQTYLASRKWAEKREQVKARGGGTCERCQQRPIHSVHHITYAHLYNEPLSDLLGLCEPCHKFVSAKGADPTKPTVYLAGTVWGSKWQAAKLIASSVNLVASDLVCNHGMENEGHDDGYPHNAYGKGYERFGPTEYACTSIRSAAAVVAFVAKPESYGTVAELAYASALGKESYLVQLLSVQNEKHYESMRNAYWFVSSFPGVRSKGVQTLTGAQETIRNWVSGLLPETAFTCSRCNALSLDPIGWLDKRKPLCETCAMALENGRSTAGVR